MYSQAYPGYQHIRPPGHPHSTPQPPLHLQTAPAVQSPYHQYNYTASPSMATPRALQGPASPSEHSERTSAAEEEYYNLPGPPPTSHIWNGLVWALEVVQHPQRARMCGFGDKDRRPISPPPCIRLIILDPVTKQEVKYDDIELAHLVLAVDIWDLGAQRELNLVKQSTTSPCISSAATGAFPTPSTQPPQGQEPPTAFPIHQIPSYSNYPPTTPAANPPPPGISAYYSQNPATYQSQRPGYPNGHNYQNGANAYGQNQNQYQYNDQRYQQPTPANPYGQHVHQSSGPAMGGNPVLASENYASNTNSTNPSNTVPPNQLFTRNLIGSLSASAFRLHDENGKLGIWFVLQDLSVRTEGWFRLKLNFFNLSQSVENQIRSITANGGENGTASQPDTTAPCLASAFSNPFKVFSAKKFPGVVESTPLSRAFATQGIKIPIRKDTQSGSGGGKRGRDGSDDDDNNSDMDG